MGGDTTVKRRETKVPLKRPAEPAPSTRTWKTVSYPISAVSHRSHAWLTTSLLALIALGPMPKHIGFVMDGNRRYARSRGQKVARGHKMGSDSLKRTSQICLRSRIPVVSVYAFAIDNFNRPQEEVDASMSSARSSSQEICAKGGFSDQHGVRSRCIGRLDSSKPDMRAASLEMEAATAHNTRGVLNVCGPYASRDEITDAVRETMREVEERGENPDKAITPSRSFSRSQSVSSAEFIDPAAGPSDILIRTSDVKRSSDFMMPQCHADTQSHFIKTYWPDFGSSDSSPISLGWQQKVWLTRGLQGRGPEPSQEDESVSEDEE